MGFRPLLRADKGFVDHVSLYVPVGSPGAVVTEPVRHFASGFGKASEAWPNT